MKNFILSLIKLNIIKTSIIMEHKIKVVICGCARNCSKYLPGVFTNIKEIMTRLDVVEIVISYDISHDDTIKVLRNMHRELSNLTVLINKERLTNQRTLNISNARNKIMDYISGKYGTDKNMIDYFIMMDLDDVCSSKLNIDTLMKTINKYGKDHDCISFNNEEYYDFWALSFDRYFYSCWHSNNPKQIIQLMKKRLKTLLNENDYINVTSAFNGFGIYKFNTFKRSRYEVHPSSEFITSCVPIMKQLHGDFGIKYYIDTKIFDCEHRMFHYQTINETGASCIVVNSFLFEKYVGEHVQT